MTEPVTLFVNRERLVNRLKEQLSERETARQEAKDRVEAENAKVRDQLVALLNDEPGFLAWVAQAVRREFGVDEQESFGGLAERFAKADDDGEAAEPYDVKQLREFVRLYELSDSEAVELAPGSGVLDYV